MVLVLSIKEASAPVLPFTVAPTAITLIAAVTAAPPGATYVPPSASTALASTLSRARPGISHVVSNVVPIARYEIAVPLLRVPELIFGGLAIAATLLHDILRRRRSVRTDEEKIAGAKAIHWSSRSRH